MYKLQVRAVTIDNLKGQWSIGDFIVIRGTNDYYFIDTFSIIVLSIVTVLIYYIQIALNVCLINLSQKHNLTIH